MAEVVDTDPRQRFGSVIVHIVYPMGTPHAMTVAMIVLVRSIRRLEVVGLQATLSLGRYVSRILVLYEVPNR